MKPIDAPEERTLRLLERRMFKVHADGHRSTSMSVHCPLKGARDLAACGTCDRLVRELPKLSLVECRLEDGKPLGVAGELISPELTVLDCEVAATTALAVLDAAGVSSAPVVDDNHVLVGVVTSAALARLVHDHDAEVEDAMVTPRVVVNQRTSVRELARVMDEHECDRVPIVGDGARLLGVVTAVEVVRWFLTLGAQPET